MLTIVRRRAIIVDRSAAAAIMTTVSLAGPALLRATDGHASLMPRSSDRAGVRASAWLLVVIGKMTLGRSFGVVPANRGVVVRGPVHVRAASRSTPAISSRTSSFLVAHPAPWNLSVILVADAALIVRALMEERVLSADAAYQQYCQRVGWHLVPGVF